MSQEKSVFTVNMLVFSLALVSGVGLIALGAALWEQHQGACPGGEADLTGNGQVVILSAERRQVTVMVRKDDSNVKLLTVDRCSGAVTGELAVKADAPPPPPAAPSGGK